MKKNNIFGTWNDVIGIFALLRNANRNGGHRQRHQPPGQNNEEQHVVKLAAIKKFNLFNIRSVGNAYIIKKNIAGK